MRRVSLFLMLLCTAGCAENAPQFTPAQKDSLRAFFDPNSGIAAPRDRESDFFAIVEAFAEMHGGGSVTLRKKSGGWTIAQKVYFL
jgi:hypothetical protein